MKLFRKLSELFRKIICYWQIGEGNFMCFSETVDVFEKQVFSTQIFIKGEMIYSLEYEQLIHIYLRFSP